jgi:hypothetical protein
MFADQLIMNDSVDFVENLFTKTLSVYDEQQFINDLFKIPEQPEITEQPPKAANVASEEASSHKQSLALYVDSTQLMLTFTAIPFLVVPSTSG